MTVGTVFVAYDHDRIQFTKQAIRNALFIKRHWSHKNVCLITDEVGSKSLGKHANVFDSVIINEKPKLQKSNYRKILTSSGPTTIPYYNSNRTDVFSLSPYDKTLLLDTDYYLMSNALDVAFDIDDDFMINKKIIHANYKTSLEDERVNTKGISLYWMTAVLFEKTGLTETVFDLMNYVRDNYFYFMQLYGLDSNIYRNDFAASIALHILRNWRDESILQNKFHTLPQVEDFRSLPIDYLLTAPPDYEVISLDTYKITLQRYSIKPPIEYTVKHQDLHVMNKISLDKFIEEDIERLSK